MKKLIFLIMVVAAGIYAYQKTDILNFASPAVKDAGTAAGKASATDADNAGGETSTGSASATTVSGGEAIGGCPMVDENGEPGDLQEVLDSYSDRLIVLHFINPDRPHCPQKSDKPHFEAINELANNHSGEAVVLGINLYCSRNAIKNYKAYYNVYYPMLTADLNSRKYSNREEAETAMKQLTGLNSAAAGGRGNPVLPTTLFIKDGKYIVGRVPGLVGYQELEDAFRAAM